MSKYFIENAGCEINMSKIARENNIPIKSIDTFKKISEDEIEEKEKQGFDLFEITKNTTHVDFIWRKREEDKINKCLFCGRESTDKIKFVCGYEILECCTDCEDEILKGQKENE
jgi:hypothetical protein